MKKEKGHIEHELSAESIKMISETYISWEKSKEQIWEDLEMRLNTPKVHDPKEISMPWMKLALAASIVVLLAIPLIMQLHTQTLIIPIGQHSSITLPDNSVVKLNAQSTLSYKPLLYKFSRKVKFEGEAFFDVQPGKNFEAISNYGTTHVLGTSFNIYSRNEDYQVTCVSGKVKVTENSKNGELIIMHGQKASLNAVGELELQADVKEEHILSWINNKFSFTSAPLHKVFEEVGRQYGVSIEIPADVNYIYTGSFKKTSSIESTLILVCKPFNLKYSRKSADEFIISKDF